MNKRILLACVAFLFVAAGVLTLVTVMRQRQTVATNTGGTNNALYDHGDWKDQPILESFTLTDHQGALFDSRDMDGKVWVTSFFFSVCPTTCKIQNLEKKKLQQEFGPQGVQFVSISCDPETDTPAQLRAYARELGAQNEYWKFLTGELLHIRRIGGEIFKVHVDNRTHLDQFIVVDKWGKIRGLFNWKEDAKVDEMKQMLTKLVAETTPPVEVDPVPAANANTEDESEADLESNEPTNVDENAGDVDGADTEDESADVGTDVVDDDVEAGDSASESEAAQPDAEESSELSADTDTDPEAALTE